MKDRSFAILLLVSGFFGFSLYYYFAVREAGSSRMSAPIPTMSAAR